MINSHSTPPSPSPSPHPTRLTLPPPPPAHTSSTCGKKVLMQVAIYQALSMLWRRWLITALENAAALLRIGSSSEEPMEICPYENMVGVLRVLDADRLFQQTGQGRRAGVARPFIRNQVRHRGKAETLERCSLPHLKLLVFIVYWEGKVGYLTTASITSHMNLDHSGVQTHEWDLTSSSTSEFRDFSHMATVPFFFFFSFEAIFKFPARYDGAV